jgi:hypothetical protein
MAKFLSVYEKILYYLVLVLLVFIPLYPKIPLFNVTGTFVAVRLEDFVIAFILLLFGGYILLAKKTLVLLKNKIILAFLVYFFVSLVSLISGTFLTHTVTLHLGFLHLLRRVELMALLPVALFAIQTRKQLLVVLGFMAVTLLLVILYAFGQQYLGWPVISTTNSEFAKGQVLYLTPGARVNSTFAGHYDLAIYLMMALILMTSLFFYFRKIWQQIAILVLSAGSFVVLVMTAARQSFLAAVCGVFIALLLSGKKMFIIVLVILAVLALLYPSQLRERLFSTLQINLLGQGERYGAQNSRQQERSKLNIPTLPHLRVSPSPGTKVNAFGNTESTSSGTETPPPDIVPGEPVDSTDLGVYRSFEIRTQVEWPNALRAFSKNPLLGTGYSSLGIATDNDFLRSLGEIGILGTAAFVLVILAIIKEMLGIYHNSNKFYKLFTAGVISVIIGVILNGLFIDVFEASKVATLFWLLCGINLASKKLL